MWRTKQGRFKKNTECVSEWNGRRQTSCVLTLVSDISGLPYLLHQGEVLSLRDPHKWILRPILGLGRDRYVFAVYHPVGWLPPLGC